MSMPMVRVPIKCPVCGEERLTDFRVIDVADALLCGRQIRLFTLCHNQNWRATDVELQQIHEYLGAIWLRNERLGFL